jgi:hypothetical protein
MLLRSASADAASGKLAAQAFVWPAAQGAEVQTNIALLTAHAGVGAQMAIPPAYSGSSLRLHVSIRGAGSGLVSGNILEPPRGFGFVQLNLSVIVTDGNLSASASEQWCHVSVAPVGQPAWPNMGVVRQASPDFHLVAELTPDASSTAMLVAVEAELRVGVSDQSNLFASGNFSSVSSLGQQSGWIEVPYLYLTR